MLTPDARKATIDLLAALDIASGTVIAGLCPNHPFAEFIEFSNKINREVSAGSTRATTTPNPHLAQDRG